MLRYPLIWLVRAWRAVVSPLYGDVCKFYPSCSAYAVEALQTHGAIRGTGLIIRRLARCHPWSEGGFDYVPGTPQCAAQLSSSESAETNQRGVV